MKNYLVGVELFHAEERADRQTDRQTDDDANSRNSQFFDLVYKRKFQ